MHGLAGIEYARTDSVESLVMMFQTIPPIFIGRNVVAMVTQGVSVDWGGWMDDISEPGQPQRLRLTPSWRYEPIPPLWIDDLCIPSLFFPELRDAESLW